MTDERIAQIEQAISELGERYSQRRVYQLVGGSHDQLQAYLRAREATLPHVPTRGRAATVDPVQVVAAMPAQTPSTLAEDLAAAVDAEQAAEARLAQLEVKAATDMLSEDEEVESIRLERRVRNLAAVITRLETEMAQAQEQVDIDGFVAKWAPLADAKKHLYGPPGASSGKFTVRLVGGDCLRKNNGLGV